MSIYLPSKRTLFILLTIILFLTAASSGGHIIHLTTGHDTIFGLRQLFDMNGERNVPALYSAGALLASSLILSSLFNLYKRANRPGSGFLLFMTFVFLYLAVDEALSIHEKLTPFARLFVDGSGLFYATWVVPGAILAGFFFLLSLPFLRRFEKSTSILMIISGAIFVGGAVGMEALGWKYFSTTQEMGLNWTYIFFSTSEEFMEMSGIALFIFALLRHAEINFHTLVFGINLSPAANVEHVRRTI